MLSRGAYNFTGMFGDTMQATFDPAKDKMTM
jgi:hypothetical protein